MMRISYHQHLTLETHFQVQFVFTDEIINLIIQPSQGLFKKGLSVEIIGRQYNIYRTTVLVLYIIRNFCSLILFLIDFEEIFTILDMKSVVLTVRMKNYIS